MADIRIKDLATTATTTASDDFMAVDGSTNGTRKMNAAAPAFLTSVTTPSLTAPASTDLTLAGGSSGASLVLGQGTTGAVAIAATSSGLRGLLIGSASAADNFPLRINYAVNAGATVDFTNTTAGTLALVRLQLVSSAGTTGLTAHSATHSAWAGATLLTAPGTGGLVLLTSNATGPIDFWTFNTQVGRFTSTGNLLIGTTTDITGSGGLKVAGTTAGSAGAGALVVTGGLSAGNNGNASYFGGAVTAASLATAQTAAAATSIVITHKIPIVLNSVTYYMALTATP
jgi:hypothetical protein